MTTPTPKAGGNPDALRSSDALREYATAHQITLPPIGPTPRRWLPPYRSLRGQPLDLPPSAPHILTTLIRARWTSVALALVGGLVGAGASALVPWALGRAVDTAVVSGVSPAFGWAVLIFVGMVILVALGDGLGEIADNMVWLGGAFPARRAITFRLADRSRALKRAVTSGDVVTATCDDTDANGFFFETITNAISSLLAIGLVTYLMVSVSVPLGLTVLIGMPITLGLIWLLGKPLEARQTVVREAQGDLTTIATDAVQGLRILRGIGGEAAYAKAYAAQSDVVRTAAIRAAAVNACLDAASSAAPLLLVSLVAGQGMVLALQGQITAGQLVAFFGYTYYLRIAIWVTARLVEHYTRARVGASRFATILGVGPLVADPKRPQDEPEPQVDWARATLTLTRDDPSPGDGGHMALSAGEALTLRPGVITGLLTPTPALGATLAKGFAWVEDPCAVAIDGVAASAFPVDSVRQAVLLSEASPQIFAGTLREAVQGAMAADPDTRSAVGAIYHYVITQTQRRRHDSISQPAQPGDGWLETALGWAHAGDVVASLPGGLDGELAEKGRNLSGGQRQRLALARAYAANPPVLVLVEPTSALDAHTEARIAEDLPQARGGQTTLVITRSPVLLHYCDEVIVTDAAGRPLARGTYAQLCDGDHGEQVRALVGRGDDL